jgi:Carbohydrate binding domain
MPVTFGSGNQAHVSIDTRPFYPYQSVPDFNPGWDRNNPGPYPLLYRNDFAQPLASWATLTPGSWGGSWNAPYTYLQGDVPGGGWLWGYDPNQQTLTRDGEIDVNVFLNYGDRLGTLFRFTGGNAGEFGMVDYDHGYWGIQDAQGNYRVLTYYHLNPSTWYRLAVSFVGQHLTIGINGWKLFDGTLPDGTFPNSAGYVGFRLWSDDGSHQMASFKDLVVQSYYSNYNNLIFNPNFDNNYVWPTGWQTYPTYWPANDPAHNYQHYSIYPDTSAEHSNGHCGIKIDATWVAQSIEQVVQVRPNTTYRLSAWVRVSNAQVPIYMGVKNFGGTEFNQRVTSTDWTQSSLTFTTGSNNTSVRIYLWMPQGAGYANGDDMWLEAV